MTLEQAWIEQIQRRWPQVDLRQDTFFDPASRQILTTDILIEGVHFSWDYMSPEEVGWRSVAVNLSDIAATGGQPQWVLVSIGVPEDHAIDRLNRIYEGIDACCREFRCVVVGGDTVRSPATTISITVVGQLPVRHQVGRRHTAKPGNLLAVSGPHGLSRAGFEAFTRQLPGYSQAKETHARPIPQVHMGLQVSRVLPQYAMMDSSDGLADAVMRLAEASQVDVILEADRLDIHPEVQTLAQVAEQNALDWVLYGGEDFQLVVTMPPETLGLFPQLKAVGYVQPALEPGHGRGYLKQNRELSPLSAEKTFLHFQPSLSDTSSSVG